MNVTNILEIQAACTDPGLALIISLFRTALTVIQIVAPILLIIMASVGFTQLMATPDDKKAVKKQINRFVAAIFILLMPYGVNTVMSFLAQGGSETIDIPTCWTAAEKVKLQISADQKNYRYKSIGDDERKQIVITRHDVEIENYYDGTNSEVSNAEARQHLEEVSENWDSSMDEGRMKVIDKGASLVGKVGYSMGAERNNTSDKPVNLDCSSFVAWAFQKAGYTDVPYGMITGSFIAASNFKPISQSELRPGDIGLKNYVPSGGANHVGIYVGKSSNGKERWLHCSSSPQEGSSVERGPRINYYTSFTIYYRYTGFND